MKTILRVLVLIIFFSEMSFAQNDELIIRDRSRSAIYVAPVSLQHSGYYGSVHYQWMRDRWCFYAGLDIHYNRKNPMNYDGAMFVYKGYASNVFQAIMPKAGIAYYVTNFGKSVNFFVHGDIYYSQLGLNPQNYIGSGTLNRYYYRDEKYIYGISQLSWNFGLGTDIRLSERFYLMFKSGITSTLLSNLGYGKPEFFLDGISTWGFSSGIKYTLK